MKRSLSQLFQKGTTPVSVLEPVTPVLVPSRKRFFRSSDQPVNPQAVQRAMLAQQAARVEPVLPEVEQLPVPACLYEYQHHPARVLVGALKRFKGALDASDTGTGKTYTACAVAKMLGFKLAVVCPKSVIPSWERVANEFQLEIVFVLNYEKLRNGKTAWCRGRKQSWVPHPSGGQGRGHFAQAENFKWLLDNETLLILDEAHRCKGSASLNAELMIAAAIGGIHTLALSATAASNPTEMKALGVLLRLFTRGEFWKWCKQYGCVQGQFGGQQFNGDQRVLAGLHRQIFPVRGARVRVTELGDRFPERFISVEAYDLGAQTEEVRRAYEEMEDALLALDDRTANYAVGALTAMMKARQKSELLKVPMIVTMIQDLLAEGNSVPVFVNFTETVSEIVRRLEMPDIGLVVGGQSSATRQQCIDNFQADRSRVLVANIRAGGIGISLHDLNGNFPRVALVCPTFSAIDLVQVLGRTHRAGALSPAVYRILYAARTIEEAACRAVKGKLKNLATLNDGDLRSGIQLNFN